MMLKKQVFGVNLRWNNISKLEKTPGRVYLWCVRQRIMMISRGFGTGD
jgi:hypothetical protein